MILNYRAVDLKHLMGAYRSLLVSIRETGTTQVSVGPMDDELAAATGLFIEGKAGEVNKLRKEFEKRLVDASIPFAVKEVSLIHA